MALGKDVNQIDNDAELRKGFELFKTLAEREDSQYSYRNSLLAMNDNDDVMGVVVSYDGAELEPLREAFFDELKNIYGIILREVRAETDENEYYLDSLAVWPEFRGQGAAHALIDAVRARGERKGKPIGLLVDKSNSMARQLYENIGFQKVGERYFMHEMMDHYMLPLA